MHEPIKLYAKYGVVLFALLLIIGYLLARRTGRLEAVAASLWAPLGVLLAVAINQPIASAVNERRPFTVFPHALVLVHRSTDASFASDHAVMAGAAAAGLFLVSRRLGALALVAALVMAFARVYVGVHFPVDVVAGLALGAVVTVAGWFVVRPLLIRLLAALGRTRLRPLVTAER